MKTPITYVLALGGFLLIAGCTTVVEREPVRHSTTTTEETTISQPRSSTVETQTFQSY